MGNDQTTLSQKDTNSLNIGNYVQISAKHNKRIYERHIKNLKQFSLIIKSISLRVEYLNYDWAQWLCVQLKKDINKTYQAYCQMFRQSLVKKNDLGSSFHIKNLDSVFLQSFQKATNQIQGDQLSSERLQKLFQQVKCYFMVQNWFLDLPLNSYFRNKQATFCTKQNQQCGRPMQFLKLKTEHLPKIQCNSSKIYRNLLKLTEIHFNNNYYDKQLSSIPRECQSPKMNPIMKFNANQTHLIKLIVKESRFEQRQKMIVELLDNIFDDFDNMKSQKEFSPIQTKKLIALTKILGLRNVYCMLKVLKQIGSTTHVQKIQTIFDFIIEKTLSNNQNPEANVVLNKPIKTNSQRKRSNIKTRQQSLR